MQKDVKNKYPLILDKIKEYQTIIIHRHMRPDPDALGSQLGLKEIIQENFPTKKVLACGGEICGLEFLGQMDDVNDEAYHGALVIVCDTANTPRVSDDRYKNGSFLIKMDHHPNDEPYGDILCVDTLKSSTSELVADFASKMNLTLNTNAARLLYAGIVGDTGRFLYPATTCDTLTIAAKLITYPFDASRLNREISQISMEVAKLSGFVYQNIEVDAYGAARVILSQETMSSFGIEDSQTAHIVSLPGVVDEVISWGIFVAQKEGSEYPYRVRLRSKGPQINTIAKRHHGGGHPLASGANARSLEECEQIYKEIQEAVKEYRNA